MMIEQLADTAMHTAQSDLTRLIGLSIMAMPRRSGVGCRILVWGPYQGAEVTEPRKVECVMGCPLSPLPIGVRAWGGAFLMI